VQDKVKGYVEYAYTHLGELARIDAQRAAAKFEEAMPMQE